VDSIPAWGKQLEADLHVGRTEVTFWAHSPIGNSSASCSVIVYVRGKLSRHHVPLGNAFQEKFTRTEKFTLVIPKANVSLKALNELTTLR
jgi:hypothetical protein